MPEAGKRDRGADEGNGTYDGGTDNSDKEPEQKKQEIEKTSDGTDVREDGKIYFLYRPRVGFTEAHSLSDVQRFYLILEPEKTPKKRLIPIGKKKVPGPKERFFGFVQAVSEKMEDLTGGMGEESHETATSGTRTTQAARIAAEGRYSIVAKDGSQTHLTWKLELPKDLGDVQKDFSIGKEGSLVLSIKNPTKKNPGRNVGLDTKADFGEKQSLFDGIPGGYAWISARDPSLLDFKNAELLFIGADSNIKEAFGNGLEEHLEEKTKKDVKEAGAENSNEEEEEEKLIDEMKKELAAEKPKLEDKPIAQQEWK